LQLNKIKTKIHAIYFIDFYTDVDSQFTNQMVCYG
jgi:hypothetical protein